MTAFAYEAYVLDAAGDPTDPDSVVTVTGSFAQACFNRLSEEAKTILDREGIARPTKAPYAGANDMRRWFVVLSMLTALDMSNDVGVPLVENGLRHALGNRAWRVALVTVYAIARSNRGALSTKGMLRVVREFVESSAPYRWDWDCWDAT